MTMKFKLSIATLVLLCQAASSPLFVVASSSSKDSSNEVPTTDSSILRPKMNARPIEGNGKNKRPSRPFHITETVQSKAAFVIGTCSSSTPFRFSIGGKSGHGAIGFESTSVLNKDELSLRFTGTKEAQTGTIIAGRKDEIETNLFSALGKSSESFHGIPFTYKGRTSKALSTVQLTCPGNEEPIDIVMLVNDDERQFAKAKVTHSYENGSIQVELSDKTDEAVDDVVAVPLEKASSSIVGGGLRGDTTASSSSIKGDKKGVTFYPKPVDSKNEAASGCSLIQMVHSDSNGQSVPKSLVVCSNDNLAKSSAVRDRRRLLSSEDDGHVKVNSAEIDDNGDMVINFSGLHPSPSISGHPEEKSSSSSGRDEIITVKFDVRIGIKSECKDETIEVVDMDAMLLSSKPTIVVNGGWFRRARELHGINDCQWEPVVIDAIVTDPESKYSYLTHLPAPTEVKVMSGSQSHGNAHRKLSVGELDHRRSLLSARASANEMDITEEMSMGRKPKNMIPSASSGDSRRNLQSSLNKKILVHGYCSGGVWPVSHFSNAITFSDPDTSNPSPSSWSHDQFARKILRFANNNGISGCGIIAHSQGGLASLHLFKSYWSCLDNHQYGGGRMIQSVGSPYKGSGLAGNLAAIGEVFGQGCGYNYDLTESGATAWLGGVPIWACNQVHYYTTSFKDNWWNPFDHCNLASDLILSDPEDGVVEKSRGQLPGGNKRGHRKGQCHTTGMRDKAQYKDRNRNSVMNSYANY